MTDQSFGRDSRVRSGDDFKRAYENRIVVSDDQLVVFVHANGQANSRLGLSVSRKVGNAVRRNRWKRRIREAFRRRRPKLDAGYDFIVIPRKGASPDYAKIADSIARLIRRGVKRWRKQMERSAS